MGFFKNLFKKKPGGTFVGNLLRGASSAATGGILGNGSQLRKWEAEQAAKKEAEALKAYQNQGYQVGSNLVNSVAVPAIGNGAGTDPNAGDKVVGMTLKKYWWAVALFVVALVGGTYLLTRRKGNKRVK